MHAESTLRKARAGLVLDHPFFGSLALRVTLQADPTCKTAWIDGKTLGYNPTWIEGLTLPQVKGVLAHELLHCALEHQARRGDRDAGQWNEAADYAVNPIIEEAGLTLPETALSDPQYAGLSADEIYSRLGRQPSQDSGQPNQSPQACQGGQAPGQPQSDPGQGQNQTQDPGGCGAVRDATDPQGNPSQSAQSASSADWKVAVTQAAQQAKAMGDLPAGLQRLISEIVEPKIPWRAYLRRFVSESAKNDFRWCPPNRRHVWRGLYLPSLRSEELPDLVVAVDTSGSIGQAERDQAAAEITSILEEHPTTTCHVVYCDAKISGQETFTHEDLPLTLHPAGGGGTDFRPPFAWVNQHGLTPACLIYLTDLKCTRFPDPPAYPVLWIHNGTSGQTPPFGEVVSL